MKIKCLIIDDEYYDNDYDDDNDELEVNNISNFTFLSRWICRLHRYQGDANLIGSTRSGDEDDGCLSFCLGVFYFYFGFVGPGALYPYPGDVRLAVFVYVGANVFCA